MTRRAEALQATDLAIPAREFDAHSLRMMSRRARRNLLSDYADALAWGADEVERLSAPAVAPPVPEPSWLRRGLRFAGEVAAVLLLFAAVIGAVYLGHGLNLSGLP